MIRVIYSNKVNKDDWNNLIKIKMKQKKRMISSILQRKVMRMIKEMQHQKKIARMRMTSKKDKEINFWIMNQRREMIGKKGKKINK